MLLIAYVTANVGRITEKKIWRVRNGKLQKYAYNRGRVYVYI